MLLEMSAATGARRGEVFALRWSDIQETVADYAIAYADQAGLEVQVHEDRETTTSGAARIGPGSLEAHRRQQDQFRQQYGPDYHSDLDLIFANPDGTPPRR
jgi:integrase